MTQHLISIRVWGDYACFTRPEMKVERVSYPMMTPSAARGILEAIFWEPQMYYIIDSIAVIKKGRWISIRRNEVTKKASLKNIESCCIPAGGGVGTQRNMLALADVEYVINAHIHLAELGRKNSQIAEKYYNEFKRRAQLGKCFHRPGLGMREFACDFEWVENFEDIMKNRSMEIRKTPDWKNLWADEQLGIMLYDVYDHTKRNIGFQWLKEGTQSDGELLEPKAYFFDAIIKDALLNCDPTKIKIYK